MSLGTEVFLALIVIVPALLGLFAFGCPQVADANEPENEPEHA